ncbi:MAG: YceI family protein [Steroidobacteraceae bacterium]
MSRVSGMTLLAALALPVLALPAMVQAAPVAYTIESGHTYPSFETPHMGISWWRGKFNHTTGKVMLDREARSGSVEIVVDIGSVDFGHDGMNQRALSDQFFNAMKWPSATYQGTLRFSGDTPSSVEGTLTMMGVTRPLTLTINSFKCITNPMRGKEVCGADAEGSFDRSSFGMTRDTDNGGGAVKLRIQVEAGRD